MGFLTSIFKTDHLDDVIEHLSGNARLILYGYSNFFSLY